MKKHPIRINRILIGISTILMGGLMLMIFFLEFNYISSESRAGQWFNFGLGMLLLITGAFTFFQGRKEGGVMVEKVSITNLLIAIFASILILIIVGTLVLLNKISLF